MTTNTRHLLGLEGMSAEDLTRFLDTADSFKEISDRPVKKVPAMRGVTVVNLFFEHSTRTRISFELAEKRLSADSSTSAPREAASPRARPCATPPRTSRR